VEETRPAGKREEINCQNRQKRWIVRGSIAAIAVCAVLVFLIFTWINRTFSDYRVLAETAVAGREMDFCLGKDVLLLCGNDGAKALTEEGKIKWEMSYQLDNPEIVYCNEVAAVADIGGTSVYIVAENGIPYTYQVLYPIVRHEVAKQGVTAVLLDNDTEDFIQLYDINGNLRVDINTKAKTDGIPIDIALSEDGQKLVTLYVTFQGNSIYSKVTFYNVGEVGKNYLGNIVGQKSFEENVLVYDIGFLSENYSYVLSENGFSVYYMREIPELVCERTTENEILDVEVTEKGIYLVEQEMTGQKKLCYYPVKGAGEKTWATVPEYERMTATEEEVIFFSPQNVTIYRANESLKFDRTFQKTLAGIFPLGGNRYFLIQAGKVQTIKLTKNQQEEGESE